MLTRVWASKPTNSFQNKKANMAEKKQDAQIAMKVSLGQSRFGSLRPQIEFRLPQGSELRHLMAALHRLAARVEIATPAQEGWIVSIERLDAITGLVFLDLRFGTEGEAERGMTVLDAVVLQLVSEARGL